jgi:hypothetical protein
MADGKNCTTFAINHRGEFIANGKKLRMFSNTFWTAELHTEAEKDANRGVAYINSIAPLLATPLLFLSSLLLVALAAFLISDSLVEVNRMKLHGMQKKIDAIMERGKLRDEILAFSSGKSSFFRKLNTINSARRGELFFHDFAMETDGSVRISGICDTTNTLDTFMKNLKLEKSIVDVNCSNIGRAKTGMAFKIGVKFTRPQL